MLSSSAARSAEPPTRAHAVPAESHAAERSSNPQLRRTIQLWGVLSLLAYAALVPISYGIAPVSPRGLEQPGEEATLLAAVNRVPAISAATTSALQRYVSGENVFVNPVARLLGFFLPLAVATLGALLVLRQLRARKFVLNSAEVVSFARWPIAFAAVSILVYPMTTQDFWLSVIWGRLTAAGSNPYYEKFSAALLAGLPIQEHGERMTYGPVWAWLSAFVALLTRHRVLLEFLAFKLLLAGAWLFTLNTLRRIARRFSPAHETFAIWLMGWLPLTLHMTVAEGHNDIVMVCFLVLWLMLVAERRHLLSPFALAASVMIKYITAPLGALELLRGWVQTKPERGRYVLALAGAALASVAVLAPFVRDRHVFDPVLLMHDWNFWTPSTALVHMSEYAGVQIPERLAAGFVLLVCGAFIVHALARYLRDSSMENYAALTLLAITTILLTAVGHVWPWFLVWMVPLCALVRRPGLITFLLVLALEGPFLHWEWIIGGGPPARHLAGVLMYTTASGAALVVVFLQRDRRAGLVPASQP